MVLPYQCYQTFGQSYKSYTERSLVDDRGNGVIGLEVLAAQPEAFHEQGELFGKGSLLELEALMQLLCSNLQHVVQLGKEGIDSLLLVLDVHAFDGHLYDVDGAEAQVAASDAGLGSEAILKHTGTASHGGAFPLEALGVIGLPVLVLVVRSIEVDEIGEEAAGCHLAGILVEVIVSVGGQVAHSAFLLPYLYGEDGCLSVSYSLISAAKYLSDDATSLGTGVCAIVDTAEHHLVSTTAMDGVHIVYECLHGLVYASHGLVDGVLLDAFPSLKSCKWNVQVVIYRSIVEFAIVLGIEVFQYLDFFDIGRAYEGSQIEVESWDGLSAVHLILYGLHADAAQYAGCFYALGRTAFSMSGLESVLEDAVKWMLDAGQ